MNTLFFIVLRFVGRALLLLAAILLVILCGVWVRTQWAQSVRDRATVEDYRILASRALAEKGALDQEVAALSSKAQELALLAKAQVDVGRQLREQQAELERFRSEHWIMARIPGTPAYIELRAREASVRAIEQARAKSAQILREFTGEHPELQEFRELVHRQAGLTSEIQMRTQLIAETESRIADNPVDRLWRMIRAQLPAALLVLAGVLLTPVIIKAFLYFVAAPLASRLPAIELMRGTGSADDRQHRSPQTGRVSAVSIPLDLEAGDRLLVRSAYIQTAEDEVEKRSRLLLDSRMPLTSLAAGLYNLVSIESAKRQQAVISATKEPLIELALVEVAEDQPVVCQPRCLAGVLLKNGSRLRITKHWRLFSLHAWLTLQLRYLVFHGPCSLVLKGCRGVRVESCDRPRMTNQSLTLGFSASARYSTTRCETFLAYVTGHESLFNDRFSGDGFFFYEEADAGRSRTGLTGRGLEGLLDAALKMFGV